MPSSEDYLTYIMELLRETSGITCKKMMGEFLLYKDGVLFGGIYDNRFLVKKTPSGKGLREQIPYPTGKPMYLVDSEDPEEVAELIASVYQDLTKKK